MPIDADASVTAEGAIQAARMSSRRGGPPTPPVAPLLPSGDDGRMEARIVKLEQVAEKTADRLGVIEQDLAVIKANYATKEDLYKVIGDQTWKLITWTTGLGAALVAAAFWIGRNIH